MTSRVIPNITNRLVYPKCMIRQFNSGSVSHKSKRFIQTIPIANKTSNDFYSNFNYNMKEIKSKNSLDTTSSLQGSKWNPYKINNDEQKETTPLRRSRVSRFKSKAILKEEKSSVPIEEIKTQETSSQANSHPVQGTVSSQAEPSTSTNIPTTESVPSLSSTTTPLVNEEKPKKKRRVLKPRKAIITLSANAIEHLQGLMDKPDGKYIRVGVQNRGCSGLTYNLEYVNEAGKFDELVEQDGVKVFIDSKALFSIVGSEMDWLEDKLSSRFIFKNPNSKGTCGCGESFMV